MIPSYRLIVAAILVTLGSTGAFAEFGTKVSKDRVSTLYRNSVLDENSRIHVATFDADEDEDYNKGNCDIAQELFKQQPMVKVKYWCEKGYFKK